MVDELGSGMYLDDQFDLSVDSTGDIQTSTGLDELEKDLAFQMAINLSQYIGQPPTGNLEAKIAATARTVLQLDSRVNSVRDELTEVEYSANREEITLKMMANTVDGEQELIFEV